MSHVFFLTDRNTVTCDFDFDMCSWTQQQDDTLDWTLQARPNSQASIAPGQDHTSGRKSLVDSYHVFLVSFSKIKF